MVAAGKAQAEAWRVGVEARDAVIAERDERIEELDGVAAHLSRLVVERERELGALREQIDEVLRAGARLRDPGADAGAAPGGGDRGVGNGSDRPWSTRRRRRR